MTGSALCVGTLILDVLGTPITAIPDAARATLIDQIRLTAAGTAAGTAVDLARLGLRTGVCGAVGDDETGEFLLLLLRRAGVDVGAVTTKPGIQTSSTILGIPPGGVRPAWHVPGANALFGPADIPAGLVEGYDRVHVGGITALPALDGGPMVALLRRARGAGVATTADCLGVKRPDAAELLADLLPWVDVFLPNDHEALTVTGASTVADAAMALRDLGAATVVVTAGPDGAVVADAGGITRLPCFDGPVVDSTGCGDAVCAGTIRGLAAGWDTARSVELGLAAAALTLQGLGSDAGIRSFEETVAFLETAPRRS